MILYEKLGIAYYYIQDAERSHHYHRRATMDMKEDLTSHVRTSAVIMTKQIDEEKRENIEVLTMRVFSKLGLPLNGLNYIKT